MTPLEAQQLLDDAECIASADTVQAALDRLAGEITQSPWQRIFRWCCR